MTFHSPIEAIELTIFGHLFGAVAEEMGGRLMRSAYSPNIKERRDFSCAVFDSTGDMIAQAAHIPVHLGSTPMSVESILRMLADEPVTPGDSFVVNDPFAGGTHLPDLTLVTPCFVPEYQHPVFWVANRAHHADIGGISPGSMPLSTHIDEEGLRLPPMRFTPDVQAQICQASRTPDERQGDLLAQVAANYVGCLRLRELCQRYGYAHVNQQTQALQRYSERIMRQIIAQIPNGIYEFSDLLDDDGHSTCDIRLHCTLTVAGEHATVDWTNSADQVQGPMNAVRSIALSAVHYAFRCLAPPELPSNSGVMRPITVLTRPSSIVDAIYPAAVSAGNVETSQRLVDVIFGALSQAIPSIIPAASCGSMNNITIGGCDPRTGRSFAYYETIAGGTGAGPGFHGGSALHSHMTNTRNTPVEALEHAYPFRISTYAIRQNSGGNGVFRGGDGLVRTYSFDSPAEVTLISERRRHLPYGLQGGQPGTPGQQTLLDPHGQATALPGKTNLAVEPGYSLEVSTPGGGGWGLPTDK